MHKKLHTPQLPWAPVPTCIWLPIILVICCSDGRIETTTADTLAIYRHTNCTIAPQQCNIDFTFPDASSDRGVALRCHDARAGGDSMNTSIVLAFNLALIMTIYVAPHFAGVASEATVMHCGSHMGNKSPSLIRSTVRPKRHPVAQAQSIISGAH